MNPARVVVKKYGNRRLYDTSTSRYVNLEDIASLVRNGTEVQVVDAGTGEDLTRITLTQIIVEDAKEQPKGLPLELLQQLIMASGHVGHDFIMWYLKTAFDAYQRVQKTVESKVSGLHTMAVSPLEAVKKLIQGSSQGDPAEPTKEVERLRARVLELEGQIRSRPAAKKGTRKPRAKSSRRSTKSNRPSTR